MHNLAIIGNPIAHSLSPQIHQHFAHDLGITINYDRIEAPLDRFAETVLHFKKNHGHGMNITAPFKEEACHIATKLTDRAKIAGAVNTFLFSENEILGDNTDGIGLIRDITQNRNFSLAGKNILILGAGGAVRGILFPLLQQSPKKIFILNRTVLKAEKLAKEFSQFGPVFSFEDMSENIFDLVIDGTVGSDLNLEKLKLTKNSLCYDLKYHGESELLKWAKEKTNAMVANGMGMLIEQAAESFFLWTGKRPITTLPS